MLSEIDPALNAAPGDVRHARASTRPTGSSTASRSRRPTPSRPTRATRVLLRYVNVGSRAALDEPARRRPDRRSPTTATAWLRRAVGRRAGRPRRHGRRARHRADRPRVEGRALRVRRPPRQRRPDARADPLSVAFGGMLTFLDTNAPAAEHRRRGPGLDAVARPANPPTAPVPVTVTATVSDATTGGSTVDARPSSSSTTPSRPEPASAPR